MWEYATGILSFETTNDVKDPNLTDRYIRIEKDPYGLFAIVGSGTTHKYLLYFDSRFPFIHQNFVHLNLGVSFTRYRGDEISDVIVRPQGDLKYKTITFPTGWEESTAINMHSLKYNPNGGGEFEAQRFTDNYSTYTYNKTDLSRFGNSAVIGVISTIIAYMLGLPLGILMARKKDKFVDKLGNMYIIFIMAVPSLAYIFMFAAIGTMVFKLPYTFANAKVKALAYVLPTISLALPAVGGLMKWMRRYMVDQMNSDYVKFARSQGLSEREIYSTHISRNAMIYIVHGIPGTLLGSITGAIITESIYSVPGIGNLLTEAISKHDNAVIVAVTVFYTSISIISLILGDLLLIKYDPRISLSSSKGGGR
ncbi:MAG: ABC transporter permease [Clostridia bacterium]|nr:ABC transporter permease [Clostridia bacterium]